MTSRIGRTLLRITEASCALSLAETVCTVQWITPPSSFHSYTPWNSTRSPAITVRVVRQSAHHVPGPGDLEATALRLVRTGDRLIAGAPDRPLSASAEQDSRRQKNRKSSEHRSPSEWLADSARRPDGVATIAYFHIADIPLFCTPTP